MSEFPTNKRLRVSDVLREDACLTDVLVDASTDADGDWLRASQTTTTELTAQLAPNARREPASTVVDDAVRSSNAAARGVAGDGGGDGSVQCATLVPIEELARASFETDRARSILARNGAPALNDVALAAATATTATATTTKPIVAPIDSQGNFVTYVVAGIQTDEQEMLLSGERVPATVRFQTEQNNTCVRLRSHFRSDENLCVVFLFLFVFVLFFVIVCAALAAV